MDFLNFLNGFLRNIFECIYIYMLAIAYQTAALHWTEWAELFFREPMGVPGVPKAKQI